MNFETVGEGTILYGQEKNNDLHDFGNLKRVDTNYFSNSSWNHAGLKVVSEKRILVYQKFI